MVVKSHRQLRHEREHNELADWLAERLNALKPYSTQIAVAALVIVVGVIGTVYYFSTENQVTAKDWSDYRAALNDREPEKALQKLYDAKPDSAAALWAAQTLGDIELSRGAGEMFQNREQAKELLDKAIAHYKLVEAGAGSAASDSGLLARARLGLGKAHEALCEPEEALRYYKLVADSEKESALGKAAAKAAKRMEDPRDVALLAWFAQQTPKKASPLSGPGGGIPGLPNDLPDRPDISVPGLDLDNIGTGVPDVPEPTLPLPGTTTTPDESKPEENQPAESKPAESKPAADADAKPAADAPPKNE
jgi:hypothetical protein